MIQKPRKKDIERFEETAKKLVDIVYEIQEYCPTAMGVITAPSGSIDLRFSRTPQRERNLKEMEIVGHGVNFGTTIDSILF